MRGGRRFCGERDLAGADAVLGMLATLVHAWTEIVERHISMQIISANFSRANGQGTYVERVLLSTCLPPGRACSLSLSLSVSLSLSLPVSWALSLTLE